MKTVKQFLKTGVVITLAVILMAGMALGDGETNGMITIGSSGEQVVYIQQLLTVLGYTSGIDGYYGEYTASDITSFQDSHGLYADGIVGPVTLQALEAAAAAAYEADPVEDVPEDTTSAAASSTDTASAAVPQSNTSLTIGSSGEQVINLQKALTLLGYATDVDGYYGSYTASSVASFQSDHGLYADGEAGPVTMSTLIPLVQGTSASAASSAATADTEKEPDTAAASDYTGMNLSVGSQGSDVTRVQQKLLDLGYAPGPADGYYGDMTKAAVIQFQTANGLYADGEVGVVTATALFGNSAASAGATAAASDTTATEELTEVQKAARAVLDEVGWDLYAAYTWSVGLNYDFNLDMGYQTASAALTSFQTKQANCVGMASTFCYMARELGFSANVIEGTVPYAAGGYGEHAWVEIEANGSTYVCDPDYEMQMGKNGYFINYGQSGTWMYNRGYVLGE